MPYKISGTTEAARIIVVEENGYTIESNTNESSGAYEIDGLDSANKLVLARKSDGEVLVYGNVSGVEYQGTAEIITDGQEGTYDTAYVYSPRPLLDGSTYKMYYTGHDGSAARILYATSTDGFTFSNHQMIISINAEGTYDTVFTDYPCVILDGSTYKMWRVGNSGTGYRILYATSTNGTTWTGHTMVMNKSNIVADASHVTHPCVIKDGSTYKMWYSGIDASNDYVICYATSTNGTSWSNHAVNVAAGSEGTYDTTWTMAPWVIKEDSTYTMVYAGYDGSNFRGITCTSSDGVNWSGHTMYLSDTNTFDPVIISDGASGYKRYYREGSGNTIYYYVP